MHCEKSAQRRLDSRAMDELLGGSLFFLYLLSVVTVINYGKLNSKQKMSVLYILTYGIGFNYVNSNKNIWALIVSFLCAVFLYEEYWNCDEYKNTVIRRFLYKLLDYIYFFVFIYKGLFFLASLFVLSYCSVYTIHLCIPDWLITSVSVFLLIFSIHGIFSNPVEHYTYTEIMKKIEIDYPYYKLVDMIQSGELERRLRLLTDIEDRFYFCRSSYTSFSWEYIKLYIRDKVNISGVSKNNITYFFFLWKQTKSFALRMRMIRKFGKKTMNYIVTGIGRVPCIIKRIIKNLFGRGHSTLEMQLFRVLSFKRGIKVGKPKTIRDFHYMIVRKVYEIIFTHIFFEGIKRFFLDNGVVELKWFRQYIVYLYMHTVIAWYNGKRYIPMAKLFGDTIISEWEMEKLFIECLGLSCKSKITSLRVMRYKHVIENNKLNEERIWYLLNEKSQ